MKSELRRKLRQRRNSIAVKSVKDKAIFEKLISLPAFTSADTILLYYSSGSEVSTSDLFFHCLKEGKTVAYPVCLDDKGIMDFFIVGSEDDLTFGMYGIKAPKKDCIKLDATEKCICVVPGLAFDKSGYRIGYGKGYYDRYLADFPGVSIGLCYDEVHIDSLPVGPHDIKVNYLITDKMIYNYNSKEDLKNG